MFDAPKIYCKYVINIICNKLNNISPKSNLYKIYDEKLYESYLKLEKLYQNMLKL